MYALQQQAGVIVGTLNVCSKADREECEGGMRRSVGWLRKGLELWASRASEKRAFRKHACRRRIYRLVVKRKRRKRGNVDVPDECTVGSSACATAFKTTADNAGAMSFEEDVTLFEQDVGLQNE